MSTRRDKIRKLRALARDKGAFENEAAVALAKAQALEASTPEKIASDIAQLLKERGLATVRVRRRARDDDWDLIRTAGFGSARPSKIPPKFDADVSYLRNKIYIEFAE
jgi:pyruvate/2-oxoglutarate dehydrogenase complex dihydrolipoamide acyltransferase (E2) component